MRTDLLGALACVEWTVSKFKSFDKRLAAWANRNIEVIIRELDFPSADNLVIAREKRPLSLKFSVEAGAYLNTIRSSLDILASSLSARNGKPENRDTNFPIFRSHQDMLDPLTGLEGKKWLSENQRAIIKALEPYPGGNDSLVTLHKLDVMRKHHRLLDVVPSPAVVMISGVRSEHVTFPARMGIGANGESLLAILSKDASPGQIPAAFFVAFSEPGHYGNMPVVGALHDFANTASRIIRRFDIP